MLILLRMRKHLLPQFPLGGSLSWLIISRIGSGIVAISRQTGKQTRSPRERGARWEVRRCNIGWRGRTRGVGWYRRRARPSPGAKAPRARWLCPPAPWWRARSPGVAAGYAGTLAWEWLGVIRRLACLRRAHRGLAFWRMASHGWGRGGSWDNWRDYVGRVSGWDWQAWDDLHVDGSGWASDSIKGGEGVGVWFV